jgi:hypothetical protein
MNHQPFEKWLLSEEPLPKEDERLLREHLLECKQCNQIENAWSEVASLFSDVPETKPSPGFVNRWQQTLEIAQVADRHKQYRWQSLIFLVAIANGAVIALFLMFLQLYNTYGSFTNWAMSWVYRAASGVVLINGIRNALTTLVRTVPQLIPPTWWIGITIFLFFSTLFWIGSMVKLSKLSRRIS